MTPINPNTENAMTTDHQTTDNFSWRRVGEVAHYYSPVINRQLTAYGAASLIFAILLLMPFNGLAQTGIFSVIYTAIPLIFMLAPIALAKSGDTRVVNRMLPAKASEKYLFLLIYFLVIIPITVYALPELALWLYTKIPAIQTEEMMGLIKLRLLNYDYPITMFMNVLSSVAAALTCLFVIEFAHHSRIIKAVVTVFGVQFAVGIMGAIYGVALVFQRGFEDGVNGTHLSEEQQANFVKDIMSDFMQATPYLITVITILVIYTGLMLWLNYRTLRKRNL